MNLRYLNFALLVLLLIFSCKKESLHKTILTIQPLEYKNQGVLDSIKNAFVKAYGFKVYILKNENLPANAITTFKGKRYNASILLDELEKMKPDSADYILGITGDDICITKYDNKGNIKKPKNKYRDFGIFGLGMMPGAACVVSDKRLKSNASLYLHRMKKVCIHEMGHNLGLPHCESSKDCVMKSAAEKLSTVDSVNKSLCINCKSQIR